VSKVTEGTFYAVLLDCKTGVVYEMFLKKVVCVAKNKNLVIFHLVIFHVFGEK